jgi:hypothetical protein
MKNISPRRWLKKWAAIGPGCWTWKGFRDRDGYGRAALTVGEKKEQQAPRVSYIRCVGSIPPGQSVLHRCDNPPCVRPSHLFLGNQQANIADMKSKGRAKFLNPTGERNRSAKITASDVVDIRSLRAFGATYKALANAYGLAGITIEQIVRRWIWAHVA